jgi:aminobenzoyl-glutamate transport protein
MVKLATSAGTSEAAALKPQRRVPGPLAILGGLFAAIAIVSAILGPLGVKVTGAGGAPTKVLSFFSGAGLAHLLSTAINNFVAFPALGVTLTMVIGLGVAKGTGALESAVRIAFAKVPARIVPYGVAFLCCQGHMLSDGAFVLLPPLAMQIFKAKGRNPLAGLVAGLACVSVGYGGGLIFGTSDVGYTAVTASAAKLLPNVHNYVIGVTMNWFITAAVGVVLPLVLGWVTVHILEPRVGPVPEDPDADSAISGEPVVTREQRRAVRIGLAAVVVYAAIVIGWWLTPGSVLRGSGGALVNSPFMSDIVPLLALAFVIFGMVYARVAGVAAEQRKLLPLMTNAMRDMSGFVVIVFILAQVTSVLTWTNLSTFFAVGIAHGLEHIGMTGYWALIAVAVLTAVMGVFIGGTALWGLEAPVLVPALMLTGLTPAALQVAFRIAVCWGYGMSPANVFLYFTYNEARKIDSGISIGWLIRRCSYFLLPGAITWFVILAVFYFCRIPIGPGAGLRLP